MRCILGAIAAMAIFTSLSGVDADESQLSRLPHGGRVGVHGMVLFGSGPHYLEHIPTLTQPHDFQIIAEVALTDRTGKAIARDFSGSTFTLRPAATFSLNDYLAGRLTRFEGAVHDGSFEQDGAVAPGLSSIVVDVKTLKFVRKLPAKSDLTSLDVGEAPNAFESNVITPDRNFQKLANKATGRVLWCVIGPDFFDPCR